MSKYTVNNNNHFTFTAEVDTNKPYAKEEKMSEIITSFMSEMTGLMQNLNSSFDKDTLEKKQEKTFKEFEEVRNGMMFAKQDKTKLSDKFNAETIYNEINPGMNFVTSPSTNLNVKLSPNKLTIVPYYQSDFCTKLKIIEKSTDKMVGELSFTRDSISEVDVENTSLVEKSGLSLGVVKIMSLVSRAGDYEMTDPENKNMTCFTKFVNGLFKSANIEFSAPVKSTKMVNLSIATRFVLFTRFHDSDVFIRVDEEDSLTNHIDMKFFKGSKKITFSQLFSDELSNTNFYMNNEWFTDAKMKEEKNLSLIKAYKDIVEMKSKNRPELKIFTHIEDVWFPDDYEYSGAKTKTCLMNAMVESIEKMRWSPIWTMEIKDKTQNFHELPKVLMWRFAALCPDFPFFISDPDDSCRAENNHISLKEFNGSQKVTFIKIWTTKMCSIAYSMTEKFDEIEEIKSQASSTELKNIQSSSSEDRDLKSFIRNNRESVNKRDSQASRDEVVFSKSLYIDENRFPRWMDEFAKNVFIEKYSNMGYTKQVLKEMSNLRAALMMFEMPKTFFTPSSLNLTTMSLNEFKVLFYFSFNIEEFTACVMTATMSKISEIYTKMIKFYLEIIYLKKETEITLEESFQDFVKNAMDMLPSTNLFVTKLFNFFKMRVVMAEYMMMESTNLNAELNTMNSTLVNSNKTVPEDLKLFMELRFQKDSGKFKNIFFFQPSVQNLNFDMESYKEKSIQSFKREEEDDMYAKYCDLINKL
jgi:hypothetical protein